MSSLPNSFKQAFVFVLLLGAFVQSAIAQRPTGGLQVQVVDPVGAVIVGATVTAVDANGLENKAHNGNDGSYVFSSLAPGPYTISTAARGFATQKTENVTIFAGRTVSLKLVLDIELEKQEVAVDQDTKTLSLDPDQNRSGIILKGTDLDILPDDQEDLTRALELLAGPSAAAGGAQFLVDGFSRAAVPPKSVIREIRINQNPFAAEYDRLGFGRIEIFTRPGSNKLQGQGFFTFSDESLGSRNPFAESRNSFQMRTFGGNLSGPIVTNRSSYFVDAERRQLDDTAVINATILDPDFNITSFRQALLAPQRRTNLSARFDYQINRDNTFTARYAFTDFKLENAGVGDFSLISKAFDRATRNHTLQLSETAVLGPTAVNVLRLQFIRASARSDGDNTIPALSVLDAFSGGGSQVGSAQRETNSWELQDFVLLAKGPHAIKFGVRWRHISIADTSPFNFGGTFTFGGGLAPLLDSNDQIVLDPQTSAPVMTSITSIERFRRTQVFMQQNLSPEQIRALGGGATQFSISAGNPQADVSQYDYALFIQDDWRARPNLTLSAGLRYESQNNMSSRFNFGPRISFAWGLAKPTSRANNTVIRGGFGIFYDRFGEDSTLRARRFNGINQPQFIVQEPDFFPDVPPLSAISDAEQSQAIRPIASNLQAPYIMQVALGIEHRLRSNLTAAATFIGTRRLHGFRSRNINAPLPGTFSIDDPSSGVRPFGNIGNIFQVESSASLNQKQLILSLNGDLTRRVTFFSYYTLNQVNNDALDASIFPANSYDLTGEYGRSALDLRHNFNFGGTFRAPFGLTFYPLLTAFSSRPFNITIGRDLNGDAVFAERPAFATDITKPGVVVTPFGAFDPNPEPGQEIIPRNFGNAPSYFLVNLRMTRAFRFGDIASAVTPARPQTQPAQPSGATAAQPVATSPASRPANTARAAEKRYTITFSVQVSNIFNRTNPATPIGNLTSPFFGRSLAVNGGLAAGGGGSAAVANRRIEAQLRFSF